MHSRAYLLAHFCFEELGKIPMIVGLIGSLSKGESVDWKKVRRRFYSHEEKIASQNGHYYAFGLDVDLVRDSDVQWLVEANARVSASFQRKNLATYVDARGGEILRPSERISKYDAEKLVQLAFESLRAHWCSESLTNPLIYERVEKTDDSP
jgi:AbiV family abortive infection protein